MHISTRVLSSRRGFAAVALAAAVAATACSIEKQKAPELMGPSEHGVSVNLTATPDRLPRDGRSVSAINVMVRDAQGKPLNGQRLGLYVDNGGLSTGEVVTMSNGMASFEFIAPPVETGATVATVGARVIGTNADNAVTRIVSIELIGPGVPAPSFNVTPATPKRFEVATFDASSTTVNGARCGGACSFAWSIPDMGTFTGESSTFIFQREGTFNVTLTVTAPGGTTAQTSKMVTVAAATKPTAAFSSSPSSPHPGDAVFFNGSASKTTAPDAVISEYQWHFGDSDSIVVTTSPTVSHTYNAVGTYTVTLVVRDNNGVTSDPVKNSVVVALATP